MIPLDPGVVLRSGSQLTATQTLDGDSSDPSPEPTEVLAAPAGSAELGRIFSRAPLLTCGECLWLEGVVPGSTVSATFSGGATVTAQADLAAVHIDVPGGLIEGAGVTVAQTACGITGPPVSLPGPFPQASDMWPAPPPRVDEPLYACQRTIHLRDLRAGATVVLRRGGDENRVCLGAAEGFFTYGSPLEPDEHVELHQEFTGHECNLIGDPGRAEVVPPAPGFPYPVCAGDRVVTVAGLIPSAVCDLIADGAPLCTAAAPAPEARFAVPAKGLAGVKCIGARQRLCDGGPWSDTGSRAVRRLGQSIKPELAEPLFDCGTAVGVTGLSAGTAAWVTSQRWQGAIGCAVANGDARVDIAVWFPLSVGDLIGLRTIRCGVLEDWRQAPVKPWRGDLPRPRLSDPADDCGGSVLVRDVVPGAIVDVELLVDGGTPPGTMGAVIGSARATTGEFDPATKIWRGMVSVPVPGVQPGALLRARQRLCAEHSEPSEIVMLGEGNAPVYRACQGFCV